MRLLCILFPSGMQYMCAVVEFMFAYACGWLCSVLFPIQYHYIRFKILHASLCISARTYTPLAPPAFVFLTSPLASPTPTPPGLRMH